MTPAEKMALIKRHSFTEWTSLVGCKVKPRQLSRHQYIITHVSDVLSIHRPVKLIMPNVSLRSWDNCTTLKRYTLGDVHRYGLSMGYGYKSISLVGLLDNYNLFHIKDTPVHQTILDWEPIDHTRDTRVPKVFRFQMLDDCFVQEMKEFLVRVNRIGIPAKTYVRNDAMVAEFIVSKRRRKEFQGIFKLHGQGLMVPCEPN